MGTRDDPLTREPEAPDRVAYATGVMLAAPDFDAEQLYHRGRLARALAYVAGWGTVSGLEVVVQLADRLLVRPGMAIDRIGRIIEVPREFCLRLDRWFDGQAEAALIGAFKTLPGAPTPAVLADVFVRFLACERGLTPAFATGPFDALDAVQPSRLRDGYELTLVARQESPIGPPPDLLPLPPPLPAPPWAAPAGGASPADRIKALQDGLLASWREGDDWWTTDGLKPFAEHVPGQDPTSIFLARVTFPADRPGGAGRPVRSGAVSVDNYQRRFVYPVGALAAQLGL